MKKLWLVAFAMLTAKGLTAQNIAEQLRPQPKSVQYSTREIAAPEQFTLKGKPKDALQNTFQDYFRNSAKGMRMKLRQKTVKGTPNPDESYKISIQKNRIVVDGTTDRALKYGLQTLSQVIQEAKAKGRLPLMTITDYPDVQYRGVVEGFYGTPWTYEDRLRQLDFYGQHRMNTYIYGPKNDPYHSSPNWRKDYPAQDAEKIRHLTAAANKNKVDFVWAIHPGQDIQWNDADRQALLHKFESMYQLGVRAFAVFFDDITGEGTNPQKQAELLNFLNQQFIKKKKDTKPLIMCPTEYNKLWSDPKKGYLKTLGQMLEPDIQIMWTGDTVIGDVSKSSVEWFKEQTGRKPFFWWNFPVSDYVRDHLLMGRAYGLDPATAGKISGVVSNPMERAEASKPAIYSLAQFAWNMKAYNSDAAWKEGLMLLMPNDYPALQTFANHHSDLGANGHRYRREESVAFKPAADEFLSKLKENPVSADEQHVKQEYQNIISASEQLLASRENPTLLKEIQPWVTQFKHLGEIGLLTLDLLNAWKSGSQADFLKYHAAVLKMEKKMFDLSHTENQNQYQPGVATGTLVVKPTVEETFRSLSKAYNSQYGTALQTTSVYMPHKIATNIPKLEAQRLILKYNTVEISPVLEAFPVAPGQYFGIELEHETALKSAAVSLEGALLKDFEFQISEDGKVWHPESMTEVKNSWKIEPVGKNTKFVRLVSTSPLPKTIRLKQFKITF